MSTPLVQLLLSCTNSGKGKNFPLDVLDFISETVEASIDDGTALTVDESLTILLDAGLGCVDEDDVNEISSMICILTCNDVGVSSEPNTVEDDDGTCDMCERYIRRTFHHLIPKETHGKYLKKKRLPANIVESVDGTGPTVSRFWLNSHGVMVCRNCHSAIHNAVPNDVLAEEYNTLDLLFTHPKIYAFAKYNSKQVVREKWAQKSL